MLRRVEPSDIAIFFEHQDDEAATQMAAFPARDRASFEAHWEKTLANETAITRAIVSDGVVVGNIGCWVADGESLVGYWIGRQHWGRGLATAALRELVAEVRTRPLYAHVAEHNLGSIRVLEKCGFVVVGEEQAEGDPIREVVLRLDS